MGAVTGEEPRGVVPDHTPVAHGHEVRATIASIDGEMLDHARDVRRATRVLHVEEDGAAAGGVRALGEGSDTLREGGLHVGGADVRGKRHGDEVGGHVVGRQGLRRGCLAGSRRGRPGDALATFHWFLPRGHAGPPSSGGVSSSVIEAWYTAPYAHGA